MSEIEKMYENAGINAIPQKTKDCNYCCYYEETYDAPCYVCTADKCPFEENIIPPFTAEKQIKLIKWMISKRNCYDFDLGLTDLTVDIFEERIASVINNLWHFLTAKEKQQVKGILNA